MSIPLVKKALITGITGQDGAYLARFLLDKNYEVHGMRLYSATDDTERLHNIHDHPRFTMHYGDLTDGGNLHRIINDIKPHEIYNLAAQSHVKVSFDVPEATANINALGTLRLLESIRDTQIRFYQASSSEMFGKAPAPQDESTTFSPCSPYASAKLYAYWLVKNYREAYGLHASNGILFNHESPLRGEEFVTRKITRAVAAIAHGAQDKLTIGNLDAKRDWGHARDYIEGMWMMLQQDEPDDFVLASGETRTVRDFINTAFACAGMTLKWQGHGLDEKGCHAITGKTLVTVDKQFFRPNEVHILQGNAAKAHKKLGWQPRYSFHDLVTDMVNEDMRSFEKQSSHNDNKENVFLVAE